MNPYAPTKTSRYDVLVAGVCLAASCFGMGQGAGPAAQQDAVLVVAAEVPLLLLVLVVVVAVLAAVEALRQRKRFARERALRGRLEMRGDVSSAFLGQVSRALTTPLNGIIGLAESLSEGAGGPVSRKLTTDLNLITGSGRRLLGLLDDIKEVSRVPAAQVDFKPEPVALYPLIEDVCQALRTVYGKVAFHNQIDPRAPAFEADRRKLKQVLLVLADEAAMRSEEGQVTITAEFDGQTVSLVVANSGAGLAPETLERYHRYFEKKPAEVQRLLDGVGVDAALARHYALQHGGHVSISSKLGDGVAVTLRLSRAPQEDPQTVDGINPITTPRVGPPSEAERPASKHAEVPAAHVLVVDDETVNRKILTNQLGLAGYRVTQASGGNRALKLLETERFDLILMDIMMPGISGYEVCRKVRARFSPYQLPIIFLTAKNQVADLVAGFENGGNDFLTKPVPKDELLTRVQTHLTVAAHHQEQSDLVAQRADELEARNAELRVMDAVLRAVNRGASPEAAALEMVTQSLRWVQNAEQALLFVPDTQQPHHYRVMAGHGAYFEQDTRRSFAWDTAGELLCPHQDRIREGLFRPREHQAFADMVGFSEVAALLTLTAGSEHQPGALLLFLNTETPDAFDALDWNGLERFRELLGNVVARARLSQEIHSAEAQPSELPEDPVEANERLVQQEKMATLGVLTAGVAHDINNPSNFAGVSLNELSNELNDYHAFLIDLAGEDADARITDAFTERHSSLRGHLETAQEGVRRIKEIVRDLTAFSRREDRRTRVVRLSEGIGSTINLVQTKYKSVARLDCTFHDDPGVACRPAQLNQVFMNLIVNSCQAIKQRIDEEHIKGPGRVSLDLRQVDDQVVIVLEDNGGGIPKHIQNRIFEPFFTTKPEGLGTGLGLAICNRIITEHGGVIDVDSRAGEGTTFTLTLPINSGDAAEASSPLTDAKEEV